MYIMEKIKDLLTEEIQYCREILEKFSDLLVRSEGRVDNINRMIGNLIEHTRIINDRMLACNEVIKREQDMNKMLIETIQRKDEQIEYMQKIIDKCICQDRNNNQNNFHMN